MEPNDQQSNFQPNPEQKDPRQELEELEELERLSNKETTPQYDPAKDPNVMGALGATAGAIGSGIYGAKSALKPVARLAARTFNLPQQPPVFDMTTPKGLQGYMNSQLEHPGVNIPLKELEDRTGQLIRGQSEAQDAISSIKGRPAMSTPDVRWVNGKFQKVGDIWTPPTAPIDISDLRAKYASMLASPEAAKQTATNIGKGVARGALKYGMPVVAGAGIGYDVQDALNRWEAGETGRAAIQGVGALGGAMSLIPTVPTRVAGTALSVGAPLLNTYLDTKLGHPSVFEKQGMNVPHKAGGGSMDDDTPFDPEATYHDDSQSALSQIADYLKHTAQNTIDQQKMVEDLHNQAFGDPKNPMQITDHDAFNKLVDHYGSAVPVGSIEHTGLDFLNKLRAAGRTPIVPVPNRWFSQPDNPAFEKMQGMVNKVLDFTKGAREDFHSGAFVDPRTGEVLDSKMMHDVGVIIDPNTGRPVMSAQGPSSISSFSDLDPKTGTITKSNLVRRALYKPVGGDPILDKANFIATIEKGGAGHKYGLGMDYATPTEMYNTMTGANPTLRPKSRGDIFGMGDVVGRVQIGQGPAHDVYEKLLVAPKGSDVPGVKLNKKEGGHISEMKAALKMKNGGLYENIHAKQERIAHGSGEHMRKPGSKGAPSEQDFIESAKTAKMKEGGLSLSVGRGEKLPVSQGAGLTAKGREKYNRETGSHLQAPQPEGGARKDSFCARMQGVVDHAKGDAERAKASLKRWKC